MKTPTDVLRDEHELILKALAVLRGAADRLEGGGEVAEEWWTDMIGWLRGFADRSHHAKEEALLFPALVDHGAPVDGGPIGMMRQEHAEGRALLQAMEVDAPTLRAVNARKYDELLRAHIDKENAVLFPMAQALLDEEMQRALLSRFQALEAEQGAGATLDDAADILDVLTAGFAR